MLRERHPNEDVLVVGHGAAFRALAVRMLGLPDETFWSLSGLRSASISRVRRRDDAAPRCSRGATPATSTSLLPNAVLVYSLTHTLLSSEQTMPRIKKAKKEKPAETTEQFIARVSKKDETAQRQARPVRVHQARPLVPVSNPQLGLLDSRLRGNDEGLVRAEG